MANVMAVHSVGVSLVTYLKNFYPEPLRTELPFDFHLISSEELAELDVNRSIHAIRRARCAD